MQPNYLCLRHRRGRLQALRPRLTPGLPKILFYRSFLSALPTHCRQHKRKNVSYQRPRDEIFFPSFGLLAFHWFDYTKFKTCTQVSIWTQNVIPGGQKGPFLPKLWKASNFNPKKSVFLPVSFSGFCRFCLIFSVHFRHAEVILFTLACLGSPFGGAGERMRD